MGPARLVSIRAAYQSPVRRLCDAVVLAAEVVGEVGGSVGGMEHLVPVLPDLERVSLWWTSPDMLVKLHQLLRV